MHSQTPTGRCGIAVVWQRAARLASSRSQWGHAPRLAAQRCRGAAAQGWGESRPLTLANTAGSWSRSRAKTQAPWVPDPILRVWRIPPPAVLDPPRARWGWQGAGRTPPSLLPCREGAVRRAPEQGPELSAADGSQHARRPAARGAPSAPRAWRAASPKEVVNSQAPAQDKHL